jgi:O-antigen/teichoic acid export membrane protein
MTELSDATEQLNKKTRYIKNTLLYVAVPFMRNLLAFLTLPILTRFLSPADYGTLSLIAMITGFSGIFFMDISNASYRYYFKYREDIRKLQALFSTYFFFLIGVSFVYGIVLYFVFPVLNRLLFKGGISYFWVLLAFIQYALGYFNIINQYILQNQHQGGKWFLNEAVSIIVQITLSIALVLTRKYTFEAIILATIAAEICKFLLIFSQHRKYYGIIFSGSLLKESFLYSWPSISVSLISFGYSYFDRVILSKFQGLHQVGLLDMGKRIATVLKMSMDGVSGTLSPLTMELLTENTKESHKKIADLNLKVSFILIFLAFFIILFTKEMVYLLMTKEYYFVMYVVPVYIYHHVFAILGISSYWLIYYHPSKTFWGIPFSLITLTTTAFANILLIPQFGVMGAAFAALTVSAIANGVQFFVGLRITPIPMDKKGLAIMFGNLFTGTVLLYILYYMDFNMVIEITIKLFMLFLFALAAVTTEIIKISEIKEMISMMKESARKVLTV